MKIFTAVPFAYLQNGAPDSHFFSRDMGLTCHALREQGVESRVVMLSGPTTKEHPDILRTTMEKMGNSDWWRRHELDAVVLGASASPEFTHLARAIKESGAKLVVRCDCGAPYSQWQKSPWRALYDNHLGPRYRDRGAVYAGLYALAKTAVHYIPAVYEKKVMEHMAHADLVMLETPEGVRLLKERLCRFGHMDIAARIKYVPHPVAGGMGYNASIAKEKRIVAVGRWDNYQKNAPLLMKSLARILAVHPDYEAHLFGGGEEVLEQLGRALDSSVRGRIHIRGKVINRELAAEYARSRILFMPSRSEGSSVAAEESLACGCSVVGSEHVLCMRNFVSKNSGTLARRNTVEGMVEALEVEIAAWERGLRDPVLTSGLWQAEVDRKAIAGMIVSAVGCFAQGTQG